MFFKDDVFNVNVTYIEVRGGGGGETEHRPSSSYYWVSY